MRCALVLSALLLLLPPPPSLSLSQNTDSPANDSPNGTAPIAPVASSRQDQALAANVTREATATVQQSTGPTSKAPVKASIPDVSSDSRTTAPVQQDKVNITVTEKGDSGNPTATSDDPKGMKDGAGTTFAPSTTTAQADTTTSQDGAKDPVTSGDQSSHNVTADLTPTKAEHPTTPHPTNPVSAPQPTQRHLVATPTSSEQDHLMTASSGSSTAAGPDYTFTGPGMNPTLPSSVPSQRTQQTSSQMPANSTAPLSQGTVQPTSPAMASRTSPLPETTSSNPTAGSTTHQVPKTPSLTSAHGDSWVTPPGVGQIKCEAPETPNEKQLILNFTGNIFCAGGPLDEKLVMLICRAVKGTFNPAQDECSIRLAPVLGSQAVAIKEITIHTKLPPKDVYERLKDKWDELKEAGVSHMQLGDQGPPEEAEDRFSMPLIITIVCMASFLLLVAALYGCCHQRLSQRKDQQRLTEELQTVENGYHDNPTLEVMETSSEMQEKKVVSLNGELGDSWIVPLDNLTKDDLDEEEDTHL
ncbi:podocalyxin isoform X1 [Aotus nancymaae]|uniref:podocalyxin isoform X1 n=1 Tax=Aotus nancymaae TaxID=37293 RepID=UPI0030FF13D3